MTLTRRKSSFGALLPALLLAGSLSLQTPARSIEGSKIDAVSSSQEAISSAIPAGRVDSTTKSLGGTLSTPKNKHGVPVRQVSAETKQKNVDTAKVVNKIPGMNLQARDLQPPAGDEPIKGFHPIKRALAPVVRLEKNSVQLQQQIMKLEGPIAALQPAMLGLHKKMDAVDNRMGSMQGRLDKMDSGVGGVGQQMTVMGTQVTGVRSDLSAMRSQIGQLQNRITDLQKPLHDLKEPLGNVATPLSEVRQQLSDMRALLASVLFAIMIAAAAIAIGTPIAAILIYKNRRKLFPDMRDHDFPVAKASDKTLTRV